MACIPGGKASKANKRRSIIFQDKGGGGSHFPRRLIFSTPHLERKDSLLQRRRRCTIGGWQANTIFFSFRGFYGLGIARCGIQGRWGKNCVCVMSGYFLFHRAKAIPIKRRPGAGPWTHENQWFSITAWLLFPGLLNIMMKKANLHSFCATILM